MKHDLPPFAVLIDADNVKLDTITPILEEMTRHGRITVRRIYGDFTSQNLAGWKGKLAEHAIQPIQQYRNTIGKNASDSALIIDAMDLLHSRRFDGFCLVSSDSDFTRLATRIREDGLVVYGFGEMKAPKAFVNACDRYIYVENLLNPPAGADPGLVVPEVAALPDPGPLPTGGLPLAPPVAAAQTGPASGATQANPDRTRADDFKPPALASALLLRAYSNVADEQGWAMVGRLSTYIHDNHSDFDPRTYGCSKFIDLLQKNGELELVLRDYKNGQSYFCRPKRDAQPMGAGLEPKDRSRDLQRAVSEAQSGDGWASIGMVGQKLKGLGRTVKEFGAATLSEALKATGQFEMRGSGAARYVRLKPAGIR